jgi:hypothetical protein
MSVQPPLNPPSDSPETKPIYDELTAARESLQSHLDSSISSHQAHSPVDAAKSKSQVASGLHHLESSILDISHLWLNRVANITDEITQIEKQVTGVDGILSLMKDTAGASSLAKSGQSTPKVPPRSPDSVPSAENFAPPTLARPTSPSRINLSALNGVGNPTGTPLIVAIEPGRQRPAAWSRRADFFVPLDGRNHQEASSLQELYGDAQ